MERLNLIVIEPISLKARSELAYWSLRERIPKIEIIRGLFIKIRRKKINEAVNSTLRNIKIISLSLIHSIRTNHSSPIISLEHIKRRTNYLGHSRGNHTQRDKGINSKR